MGWNHIADIDAGRCCWHNSGMLAGIVSESVRSLMQQTSDASLLFAAARSRDGEAIGELVRRYASLLYSVARRVSGDDGSAARLARQEVADLAERPDRIRGEPAVWIHESITRRTGAAHPPAPASRHRDLVEEPHWDEVGPAIDATMLRLSRRDRNIIIQHYFQRHAQDELAEMLQVTQPVVARRLRKALEALRLKLVQAGVGCSLAQLMMLLARHAASDAPPGLADELAGLASSHLQQTEASPSRTGWLGLFTVWAVVAGLIVAVAASYSGSASNPAGAHTTQPSGR